MHLSFLSHKETERCDRDRQRIAWKGSRDRRLVFINDQWSVFLPCIGRWLPVQWKNTGRRWNLVRIQKLKRSWRKEELYIIRSYFSDINDFLKVGIFGGIGLVTKLIFSYYFP